MKNPADTRFVTAVSHLLFTCLRDINRTCVWISCEAVAGGRSSLAVRGCGILLQSCAKVSSSSSSAGFLLPFCWAVPDWSECCLLPELHLLFQRVTGGPGPAGPARCPHCRKWCCLPAWCPAWAHPGRGALSCCVCGKRRR